MACIDERVHLRGNVTYRVRFRKRKGRCFSFTFDSREEAVIFIREWESVFNTNPEEVERYKHMIYLKRLANM